MIYIASSNQISGNLRNISKASIRASPTVKYENYTRVQHYPVILANYMRDWCMTIVRIELDLNWFVACSDCKILGPRGSKLRDATDEVTAELTSWKLMSPFPFL